MFFLMQAVKYGLGNSQLGQAAEKKAKEIEKAYYESKMQEVAKKAGDGEISDDEYWRRVAATRKKSFEAGDSFRAFSQDVMKMKGVPREMAMTQWADAAIKRLKDPSAGAVDGSSMSPAALSALNKAWDRRMTGHDLANLSQEKAKTQPTLVLPPEMAKRANERKKPPTTTPADNVADAGKKETPTTTPKEDLAEANRKKTPNSVPDDNVADAGKKETPTTTPKEDLAEANRKKTPNSVPDDNVADAGKKETPTTTPKEDLAEANRKKTPNSVPDDNVADAGKKETPNSVPDDNVADAGKKETPNSVPDDNVADAGKKKTPNSVPEEDGTALGNVPKEPEKPNAFRSRIGAMNLGTLFPQMQSVDWRAATKAEKLVSGSVLTMGALKKAYHVNGMDAEFGRIEEITGKDNAESLRLRYDAACQGLFGLTYSQLAKRATAELFSMAQESAHFALSNAGFSIAAKASSQFNPQAGVFYGHNLGNGLGVAAWAMRSPLSFMGEWGDRVQIESDLPYFGFAFGYQRKPSVGFTLSAIGLAIGKADKNVGISRVKPADGQAASIQLYLPAGITAGNHEYTGTLGIDVRAGVVWSAGTGKIGVEAGGIGYLANKMKGGGSWKIESFPKFGPQAAAFYRGERAGVQLSFRVNEDAQAAAGAYAMLVQSDRHAIKAFADYLVDGIGYKTGVWEHSLGGGLEWQGFGDLLNVKAGTRQSLDIKMPGKYARQPGEYYLTLGARLF